VDFQRTLFIWLSKFFLLAQLLSMGFSSLVLAQETHEDWVTRGNCLSDESKESLSAIKYLTQTDRSLNSFDAMDPQCRKYILAGLVRQDFYIQERKGTPPEDQVPDRDLILRKYLGDAPPDFQLQVYEEALVGLTTASSASAFDAGLTNELFQTFLKNEPGSVSRVLCRVMWNLGTFDKEVGTGEIEPERLGRNMDYVDRLQPLLSQRPALAGQVCNFPDHKTGQIHQYTIGGLIDLAVREAQKKAGGGPTRKDVDATEWIRLYSSCREEQLVSIFHNATQFFKQTKPPSQILVIETQGTCSVQGVLRRTSATPASYLFYPSSQIRFQEPETKPIVFSNVFEIARILKHDPRTYILNRTQAISKPAVASQAPEAPSNRTPPNPPSDGTTLRGAFEAVQQFFKSGAEAVMGRGR
jgi:hypothetical protein